MTGELAARVGWNPAWRSVTEMPAGPVDLWVVIVAEEGEVMGAAPAGRTGWRWAGGRLCYQYGPVRVPVLFAGRYATGHICAVSEQARVYRPLWAVGLGEPQDLRAGDTLTITDGYIAVTPEGATATRLPEVAHPALG
jgi:hypothetical protein